ncbi:hypothetical protein FE783_13905 [Paenibacillus mesophilus]|uniref:hypothetical protein n=1 Tax=Paenibacillus mesophilus TaxID=2582849 RepID=UPI00110E32B3|nr:hypothetical protein [Paenibacillus mesophilus]TMV49589.1 hypothetical protein FE783_13905 [Paenibacillus mesophilus]
MSIIQMPTGYYRQYDTDFGLEVPAEAFGGWAKQDFEFDLSRTAIVAMHAGSYGSREQSPGRYRSIEYLPRSDKIAKSVFPGLLRTVRDAGMKVYHVPFPGDYYQELPGYKETQRITPPYESPATVWTGSGSFLNKMKRFRGEFVFPGIHNVRDNRLAPQVKFYPESEPVGDEGIAENEQELFALCRRDGIEHLVYIGFAIDGCLLASPGGMLEMSKRGLVCSTIREAVTAIETKETARHERAKDLALWRVSILFGFVYELDDFVTAIRSRGMSPSEGA